MVLGIRKSTNMTNKIESDLNNFQKNPKNDIYTAGERVYEGNPLPEESRKFTNELLGVAIEVSEKILPYVKSVILFGSGAYGANYSVNSTSDIDLEIIIDDLPKDLLNLSFFKKHEKKIDEMVEPFFNSPAQILLYKFDYKGKEVSCNFIKKNEFEKLMSIDLINTNEKMSFIELRNYFKGSLLYKNRRSFNGDTSEWNASSTEIGNNLFLVELPFYQIENGHLYNGIFPEWHLTKPIFLGGDYKHYHKYEEYLFSEYVKRMVYEENKTGSHLKFTNILARKERMSSDFLSELDRKADLVREQIKDKLL